MEFFEKQIKFFEGFGGNTGKALAFTGFFIGVAVLYVMHINLGDSVGYAVRLAPIYLPVITFVLFYEKWLEFVRLQYNLNQGRVTLEIKIPQEIYRSPEAMEMVLNQMYQTASPDNHIQTYWDGKHPPKFSLEIVSRGGDVHFYINTPRKKFKNIIEAQLYSQYPGIEVTELPIDYTAEVPWDPSRFSYFSFHFGLKNHEALPIKTYIEYKLHDMPKEEEKTDPITSLLDALGSIGPGEYYWIQILIDAHRETNFKLGTLHGESTWTKEAREQITKILENAQKRVGADSMSMMHLTDSEKETIAAIDRRLGKNAFNTAIRGMYIGTTEAYRPGESIGALTTAWRGFDNLNTNLISPRWRTDFDWNWWQDPKGARVLGLKRQELGEYKRRVYSNQTGNDKTKVMTVEDLATIFHLPGKVAITPSLARIPSKRGEPPSNLPV